MEFTKTRRTVLGQLLIALTSTFLVAGCADEETPPATTRDIELSHIDGVVLEVEILALSGAASRADADDYGERLADLAGRYGGRLQGEVMRVTEDVIDNAALPATVVPLDAQLISIVSFASAAEAEAYANDEGREVALPANVVRRTRVFGSVVGFPAGAPALPLYGEAEARPAPAFTLFNALHQKPDTDAELTNFFLQASQRVMGAGGQFSAVVETRVVTDGTFPYQRFTFVEWPDQQAFDAVHEDPEFIDQIAPIRNGLLDGFIEAKVVRRAQEG